MLTMEIEKTKYEAPKIEVSAVLGENIVCASDGTTTEGTGEETLP